MTWVRFWIGRRPHVSNAHCAFWMASSTSSLVQHGASAMTSPVLESVTGMYLSVFDVTHSPFTKYFSLFGSSAISFLSHRLPAARLQGSAAGPGYSPVQTGNASDAVVGRAWRGRRTHRAWGCVSHACVRRACRSGAARRYHLPPGLRVRRSTTRALTPSRSRRALRAERRSGQVYGGKVGRVKPAGTGRNGPSDVWRRPADRTGGGGDSAPPPSAPLSCTSPAGRARCRRRRRRGC